MTYSKIVSALNKVIAEEFITLHKRLPRVVKGKTFLFPSSFRISISDKEFKDLDEGMVFKTDDNLPMFKIKSDSQVLDFLKRKGDKVELFVDNKRHKIVRAVSLQPYLFLVTKGEFVFK